MPKHIVTGVLVQAAIVHTTLTIGITAALLLGMIGTTKTAASQTELPTTWVDPDQVINLPENTETSDPQISPRSEVITLSWNLLDHTADYIDPNHQSRGFEAIEGLLNAGQVSSASALLDRFKRATSDHPQSALWRLLEAKTFYMGGYYKKALRSLGQLQRQKLSSDYRIAAVWLETGSLLGANRTLEALKLTKIFSTTTQRPENTKLYELVWRTLRGISASELDELKATSADSYSIAWLDIARIFALEPTTSLNFSRQLVSWQKRNPQHTANLYVLPHIALHTNPAHDEIRRIALLLPISSSFGRAAEAIRDGFLFQSQQTGPSESLLVRIYDFGDQTDLIHAYYDAALRDQVDFVVGPVGTIAVKELAKRGEFPIATLLLGNFDDTGTYKANTYQFSLSPEDDATALAKRGFDDGHRRVIALYPDTPQGRRIFAAWSHKWQKQGGIVIQSHAYDTNVSDYSQILRASFNLDQSAARRKALQEILKSSVKLKFTARRRQDIDALFLFGDSHQTRLIKPQIDFHHAHDLAVYSLNNYTGTPDPIKDLDLEGIVFSEMPWILNYGGSAQAVRKRIPAGQFRNGTVLDRLFALGVDAFGLINSIEEMKKRPNVSYPGITGDLFVNKNGRVRRKLEWFQFRQAKPDHLRLATLPVPPKLELRSYNND